MSKGYDTFYKLMVLTYKVQDLFSKPGDTLLQFDICEGQTVVDYGCGPGRYINKASELVGENGKVIAADINQVAIKNVIKRIRSENIKNVVPILLKDGSENIEESSADVVYALDMFHQIDKPAEFLSKIHRIVKNSGWLYLEDGHQSRTVTLDKVRQSDLWKVYSENDVFIRLKPFGK